ncbi:MAG: NAD-dependent epimerase/dehydratase family protein [Solirubrobacteraceae bacterium]
MGRVLVTGGAGMIGGAVARALLGDPRFEVRISDHRPAPQWIRESCEVHSGDLRSAEEAREAMAECTHVVHAAAVGGGIGDFEQLPHTLAETNSALNGAMVRAALDVAVERFVYVSSSAVFERATVVPTPEEHLLDCPAPRSAYGFSKLAGELLCRAAGSEHDLPFSICRPWGAYGPGEPAGGEPGGTHAVGGLIAWALEGRELKAAPFDPRDTRTPTHVDDLAGGIIAALTSPAALHEDFNLAAAGEVTLRELATMVWDACGRGTPSLPATKRGREPSRRHPSVAKAARLLGWRAQIDLGAGIENTVTRARRRSP